MAAIASAVALITAIAKAFPIVDKWLSWCVQVYLQYRFKGMEQENIDAIHVLLTSKDQRDVEKLLGYSKAGEPSGIPGSVIVPELPGVSGPTEP
jgi:hypothetical protein